MNLRYLETLECVARTGSLAAAARDLELTANAVALRVRALEEEFDIALIRRSGRTVRLTEAGHAVLEGLPQLQRHMRDMRAAAAGSKISGELRLGAINTALTGLLPPILDQLSREHPDLKIRLVPGTSAELYARVRSEELDTAAIVDPSFALPKSMAFEVLASEPLVLIVPPDERRDDPLAILASEPVILYDRSQWGGRVAASWIEKTRIAIETRLELDALDSIAILVGRGIGVAVVPDWTGPRPAGIAIRTLTLPPPVPIRRIGLLSAVNGSQERLVRAVIKVAKGVSDRHPPGKTSLI